MPASHHSVFDTEPLNELFVASRAIWQHFVVCIARQIGKPCNKCEHDYFAPVRSGDSDEHACVCGWVCVSVCEHIWRTTCPNFEFSVYVVCLSSHCCGILLCCLAWCILNDTQLVCKFQTWTQNPSLNFQKPITQFWAKASVSLTSMDFVERNSKIPVEINSLTIL